ncbi:hypothetical protein [Paenibacillus hamazuiensis]|uniref:hypothetical protein n=1 Tax=Paenibacillus hamazuiensis TaxID=2936508 RepID=UPI00200FF150|nr:hypothetical protein [Paenibacillus hamazuiensis]
MGQRANLVIVKEDGYNLYYNHWCANTLPGDLFWGPKNAISFIEAQNKVDDSGWLNDIWAEGGALIDLNKKLLLFYGGEDELWSIPYRRIFLNLMQSVWGNWEIRWAYNGILDIASYVGVPEDKVRTNKDDDLCVVNLEPPEEKSWVDTIGSIKFDDGHILIFPLYGGIEGYLLNGPRLIQNCNKSIGHECINFDEWTSNFPSSGFHVDLNQMQIDIWHATVFADLAEKLKELWPDWKIIDHYDQYEVQLEKTAGCLKFPTVDQKKMLNEIKDALLRSPTNPLDALSSLVGRLQEQGQNVEVSHYAFMHGSYELSKEIREEIIENAFATLNWMEAN